MVTIHGARNSLYVNAIHFLLLGETKAEMRSCLWRLPLSDPDADLTDDGSVESLEKLADLGTEEHGDMKLYVLFDSSLKSQVFHKNQPIPTIHHSKIVASL